MGEIPAPVGSRGGLPLGSARILQHRAGYQGMINVFWDQLGWKCW